MQKALLSLVLLFLSFCAQAQHLQWGMNVMPGISYRLPQGEPLSLQAESIQNAEQPMYTFDFGMDIRTSITSRLSIGTGVLYSQKGFSNTHLAAVYKPNISRRYLIDYVQDYLEVPVFLTYELSRRDQFRFYPLAGLTNNLLIRARNNISLRSGEFSEETGEMISRPYLQNSSNHSLSLLGGFGIMAEVDDKSAVGIEALGKVMLTPLNDRVSMTERHLYSLGVNFRFVRKIR
ncbi:MAG: outer membrane beta-barrel protein [Cyclobacteriaceae bacterium]